MKKGGDLTCAGDALVELVVVVALAAASVVVVLAVLSVLVTGCS